MGERPDKAGRNAEGIRTMRASLTVEAAFCVPVVFLAIYLFLQMFLFLRVQADMQSAMTSVVREVAEYGTVKLYSLLGTCVLMELIDILSDYRRELTSLLKSNESLMCLIGLSIGIEELSSVKVIELFGMLSEERMRDDIYGTILKATLLIIDTVSGPEIGDTAFCGYAGTA